MRHLTVFLVAALAFGAVAPSSASDHDRARRAVEEGRILPLKEILARAQGAYPGQVIEAELEDEGGMVVYEIKILAADGRVTKLYYNAATGDLLKAKDRNRQR